MIAGFSCSARLENASIHAGQKWAKELEREQSASSSHSFNSSESWNLRSQGWIGSCTKQGPAYDHRLNNGRPCGTFASVREFHDFLIAPWSNAHIHTWQQNSAPPSPVTTGSISPMRIYPTITSWWIPFPVRLPGFWTGRWLGFGLSGGSIERPCFAVDSGDGGSMLWGKSCLVIRGI